MRLAPALLFALACAVAAPASAQSPASGGSQCDRNCLTNLMDRYLAAMVRHDAAALPLASRVRYTENTAVIPVGDGLWVGASEGPSTFKIYAADPTAGQTGFFGVIKEFDRPVLLALRLKVEQGKITEIEHVVARDLRPAVMASLAEPQPGFLESVRPSERVSRQEMLRIANSYFDSIEQTNGNVAPFADDCERRENGVQTTTVKTPQPLELVALPGEDPANTASRVKLRSLGCRDSMSSGSFRYITKIQPRRPLIVDEEMGLVFTFPMFVHRGNVRTVEIVGVPGVKTIRRDVGPSNLQAGEIFKIRGGKIHEIEANGSLLPYGAMTGWE
jgi:hypothetical protein